MIDVFLLFFYFIIEKKIVCSTINVSILLMGETMLKKILLLAVMVVFLTIPWYKKYIYIYIQKYFSHKNCLIDLDCICDVKNLNICSDDDLRELVKVVSMYDPSLLQIDQYDDEKKISTCKQIIENYIIDPYIVEKYLEDNNLVISAEFIKDKEMFMKIMQNNFYINVFRKYISKEIFIDDDFARSYYEGNKFKEFNRKPFVKSPAFIDARIIEIKSDEKGYSEYELLLLDDKTSIPLNKFNPYRSDSVVASTLKKMKKKTYDVITLEDNKKYMLYKIDEIDGMWFDYDMVKNAVKKYLHEMLLNEKMVNIVNEIKDKCNIKVCQKKLTHYVKTNTFFTK